MTETVEGLDVNGEDGGSGRELTSDNLKDILSLLFFLVLKKRVSTKVLGDDDTGMI